MPPSSSHSRQKPRDARNCERSCPYPASRCESTAIRAIQLQDCLDGYTEGICKDITHHRQTQIRNQERARNANKYRILARGGKLRRFLEPANATDSGSLENNATQESVAALEAKTAELEKKLQETTQNLEKEKRFAAESEKWFQTVLKKLHSRNDILHGAFCRLSGRPRTNTPWESILPSGNINRGLAGIESTITACDRNDPVFTQTWHNAWTRNEELRRNLLEIKPEGQRPLQEGTNSQGTQTSPISSSDSGYHSLYSRPDSQQETRRPRRESERDSRPSRSSSQSGPEPRAPESRENQPSSGQDSTSGSKRDSEKDADGASEDECYRGWLNESMAKFEALRGFPDMTT
ncbi:hypothetical protein CDD81_980 [Ophiocordyceps australis]|uniref:Uncharacterized protein n=1 Tax=Ophiocordyceps australis TaxID=1399860 RepID=A0A2C5XUM9_9HYPO|nr:hypothetical protein CDD81_980 [Ophiocordyceps australis]